MGLSLAVLSFVGSHELLSHPLRKPLVTRIGEKPFMGLYLLVALATFGWVIFEFRAASDVILWTAPLWVRSVGAVAMVVASVLFVGSLTVPNPALTMAGGLLTKHPEPRGVLRITRHPMMWSFALWALVHAAASGTAATLILCAGIGFLALFGAAMQDRKKAAAMGEVWTAWQARTSYLPFGRGFAWPDWKALIGGALLYLLATWAHPLLGAPLVGVWSLG